MQMRNRTISCIVKDKCPPATLDGNEFERMISEGLRDAVLRCGGVVWDNLARLHEFLCILHVV